MEAKKIELDRFVRAVRDPEVRESIHSRKLAPDFARQQKEIRHSLQVSPSSNTFLSIGRGREIARFNIGIDHPQSCSSRRKGMVRNPSTINSRYLSSHQQCLFTSPTSLRKSNRARKKSPGNQGSAIFVARCRERSLKIKCPSHHTGHETRDTIFSCKKKSRDPHSWNEFQSGDASESITTNNVR